MFDYKKVYSTLKKSYNQRRIFTKIWYFGYIVYFQYEFDNDPRSLCVWKKPIAWSNQGFVATFNARNSLKIKSYLEKSLLEMIVIDNLQQRACNCVVITSLKDFNALQWRLIFFLQHWYLITTSLRYFRLKCKKCNFKKLVYIL